MDVRRSSRRRTPSNQAAANEDYDELIDNYIEETPMVQFTRHTSRRRHGNPGHIDQMRI